MEKEKAIEILNALAWVQGGPDREETITAILMAIEALSASGDLISRAEAIDAIMGEPTDVHYSSWYADQIKALPSADAVSRDAIISAKFHPLPYTHITPADVEAESYKRGWNDALDAVADNAPSAEAVHGERWIPCSERLPRENGVYIVSLEDAVYPWATFHNGGWFMLSVDNTAREFGAYEVIAWMPLPTPYKGGDNE